MAEYRLGSSTAVYTPGIIAWAINGYAFERDRATMLKVITEAFPGLPVSAARQLLSKAIPYTIEGETVVFSVADTEPAQ